MYRQTFGRNRWKKEEKLLRCGEGEGAEWREGKLLCWIQMNLVITCGFVVKWRGLKSERVLTVVRTNELVSMREKFWRPLQLLKIFFLSFGENLLNCVLVLTVEVIYWNFCSDLKLLLKFFWLIFFEFLNIEKLWSQTTFDLKKFNWSCYCVLWDKLLFSKLNGTIFGNHWG